MKNLTRRSFVQTSAAAAATLGFARSATANRASNKLVAVVMGTNGRGLSLAQAFLSLEDTEVAYICDPDDRAIAKGMKAIADKQARTPAGIKDFRQALDDEGVDLLICAAPNHWHAPATILACAAGKHVYVEKPCCQNPAEGEMMIAAARKHDRAVTMGTQRRSSPLFQEAIGRVRSGELGEVFYSRSWYNNRRGSIGRGKQVPVPEYLDFALWQGPAPARPYQDNLVHYNWHNFWHWGNGELGNNGVHSIDISRWGLGVDYPNRVTSAGRKLRYDDDQQTPDTHLVTFEFDGKTIVWEALSWSPHGTDGEKFGISFHGDKGTLVLAGAGYKLYDMQDKLIETKAGGAATEPHVGELLAAIRDGRRPTFEIEEAHKSTLLCHLGNIAHRTGRHLKTDPENGHILGDAEAAKLWSREYQPGWEPQV